MARTRDHPPDRRREHLDDDRDQPCGRLVPITSERALRRVPLQSLAGGVTRTTIFIVGLFAVFGTVQGGVAAITSQTTRRWITIPARLVCGLSYLVLGGGAGVLVVPFLWFGALSYWRTTWHRRLRVTLAVLAAANMAAVVGLTLNEDGVDRLHEPGVVAGFALFAAAYAVAVRTAGPTFGPSPRDGSSSTTARRGG